MLYPSIDSLMRKLDSKYTLVTVAAKRARQLQLNDDLMIGKPVSRKYVGKALEEIDAELLSYTKAQKQDNEDSALER
ncbi:DNA-directed RNA polymerase subunit omega [Bacillus songklensis]|uniref:DNA-directed RNA polymerase subunit omega n=1 Tax=Bacillus songklensis TaxID=1069116 RepID=A0ABV8B070_9BACI